jgi:hypothetical protein
VIDEFPDVPPEVRIACAPDVEKCGTRRLLEIDRFLKDRFYLTQFVLHTAGWRTAVM